MAAVGTVMVTAAENGWRQVRMAPVRMAAVRMAAVRMAVVVVTSNRESAVP
jgi:hypothetical protein